MPNLPLPEPHPEAVRPARRADAGGAADLMAQGTRAWETDGGAVLGRGVPGAAGGEPGLGLAVRVVPGRTCVEIVVRGELDLATAPQLRAAVAGACRPEVGHATAVVIVVLDLTDVTFMDSAALYALSDISAQVAGRGWSLRVTPPVAQGPRRLLVLAAHRKWLPRWRTGLAVAGSGTTRRADGRLPRQLK